MKSLNSLINYRLGAIARSSLMTMGVFVLRLFVQVALLFSIARFLGPDAFGAYVGVSALGVVIGSLSSVGTGYLVLGSTSKFGKSDPALIEKAMRITLLFGLLLVPVYIWLAQYLFETSTGLLALVLIGLTELLFMPMLLIYIQRLQALGKVAKSQFLLVVPLLGRLALLVPLLVFTPSGSLELYGVVHSVTAIATLGICMVSIWPFHWKSVNAVADPRLLRKGMPYAVMRFTSLGPGELDKVLALRLLGPLDTGLFGFAARGVAVTALPVTAMVLAAQPRIFKDLAYEPARAWRLIWTVCVLAGIYGLLTLFIFRTLLPQPIEQLLGSEYGGIASVLVQLSLIVPLISVRLALAGMTIALSLPGVRTLAEWIGIAALALGALVWVPELGVPGLVRAIIVSEVLMSSLLVAAFVGLNAKSVRKVQA